MKIVTNIVFRALLLSAALGTLAACSPQETSYTDSAPAEHAPAAGASSTETAPATTETAPTSSSESHDHSSHASSTEASHDHGDHGEHAVKAVEPSSGPMPAQAAAVEVRAVPASFKDTAVAGIITNTSDEDIELVAVHSPAAEHTMLMTHHHEGGAMKMVGVESLIVPAKGVLELQFDGDHLMLMGLHEPLQEGAIVPFVLQDSQKRTLEFEAVVVKP